MLVRLIQRVTTSSHKEHDLKAFTLIELVVSTGIIVLMLALSLPAFSRFQREQQLNIATTQIRDAVLTASNYALAPREEKPDSGDYYRVMFTQNPATYHIEEYDGSIAGGTWQVIREGFLTPAVTLSFESSDGQNIEAAGIVYSISRLGKVVRFNPVNGTDTLPVATYTIAVKQAQGNHTKLVTIETVTGRVEIVDVP